MRERHKLRIRSLNMLDSNIFRGELFKFSFAIEHCFVFEWLKLS